MSSNLIDDINDFWQAQIIPAAESLRARGVSFFTPADAKSTWITVPEETPDLFIVERETLVADLEARWAAHPELKALVAPLLILAESTAAQISDSDSNSDNNSDVSSSLYVMF